MEYGSVRKMENVVEAVAVWVKNVVGERLTNKNSVPLKITLSAFSLSKSNLEMLGQSFFIREGAVECWQA